MSDPVGRLHASLLAKLGEGHAHFYPVELERQFPRILERLVELWNSPELDYYFEGLMTTTRHDRQGFPEAVALELFHLANLHGSLHLSDAARASPWDIELDPDLFKKAERD